MFVFDAPAYFQALLNQHWLVINYLLIFGLFSLAYITFKKPVMGAGLVVVLLPTYLLRSKISWVPVTYLELTLWTVFLVWLFKSLMRHELKHTYYQYPLRIPIAALIIAGIISVAIAPNKIAALGLWKAYLIEPLIFYVLLLNVIKTAEDKKIIIWSLGLSTLSISLIAIFQKITGLGIAEPQWVISANRRVTAFFTSPNAIGLYLGPITALYLGWLLENIKKYKDAALKSIIITLAILAIIFTVSQGAYIGLIAGILFLLFFSWNKKWTIALTALAIIVILSIPQLRQSTLPYVTFSDPAGQNRLGLWQGSIKYLTSSPQHFIFGAGIFGFPAVHESFRNPLKTEPLIYPHNIILNFWMELGLLGLLAFGWIITNFFATGYKKRNQPVSLALMAAVIVILVHGLVDVPYFKNDLSMLFWILVALMYVKLDTRQ